MRVAPVSLDLKLHKCRLMLKWLPSKRLSLSTALPSKAASVEHLREFRKPAFQGRIDFEFGEDGEYSHRLRFKESVESGHVSKRIIVKALSDGKLIPECRPVSAVLFGMILG
jgi:hypothetical protein